MILQHAKHYPPRKKITIDNQSRIPTERLREIVRFVKPPHTTARIIFKNASRSPHGYAWTFACIVYVPPARCRYPIRFKKGSGYQGNIVYSETETIVDLTAHELRHCQRSQNKVRVARPKGGRRKGRSAEEADCDIYALRKLRAWRRHGRQGPGRLIIPQRIIVPQIFDGHIAKPEEREIAQAIRRAGLMALQKKWITKGKRAITALAKLEKKLARMNSSTP